MKALSIVTIVSVTTLALASPVPIDSPQSPHALDRRTNSLPKVEASASAARLSRSKFPHLESASHAAAIAAEEERLLKNTESFKKKKKLEHGPSSKRTEPDTPDEASEKNKKFWAIFNGLATAATIAGGASQIVIAVKSSEAIDKAINKPAVPKTPQNTLPWTANGPTSAN